MSAVDHFSFTQVLIYVYFTRIVLVLLSAMLPFEVGQTLARDKRCKTMVDLMTRRDHISLYLLQ